MTSRREFLKQAGAFALGAPFLVGRGARLHTPSCVVIGAGLAGLAAAYRLVREGWEVTVVEARERLGGRVFTWRMDANPSMTFELGAEWVGASHERIQALCCEFALEVCDHRFQISLLRDGKVSGPGNWRFSPEAEHAFERLRAWYEKARPEARAMLDRYDWWTCLQQNGFPEDDLLLRDLFDSTDFGESIRQVSAQAAASEYFESSPDNEMDYKIVGGNSRLVEELAARIGPQSIRTGIEVTEIRQRRGAVTVVAGSEAFTADWCICTVPSRMLRKIRFDPPLPKAQAAAADELQYARIIKSSVLYDERFWKAEDFSLVSDRTAHYYFHSTKDQRDEGAPAGRAGQGILTSYAIGEKADVLAAQSNPQRMEIIARDLIPLDERAPALAKGIASYAWQRDRYAEGAYAVYRPGQWSTLRTQLARPHDRVLFAGEHLADWQGFMEGAIVTGEEAAGRIIR